MLMRHFFAAFIANIIVIFVDTVMRQDVFAFVADIIAVSVVTNVR